MDREHLRRNDELSAAFDSGSVFDASQEKLREYLITLSTGHVENEMVRHREMIRALVINTIKMQRLIDRIDRSNFKYTVFFAILTAISVWPQIVQAIEKIRTWTH